MKGKFVLVDFLIVFLSTSIFGFALKTYTVRKELFDVQFYTYFTENSSPFIIWALAFGFFGVAILTLSSLLFNSMFYDPTKRFLILLLIFFLYPVTGVISGFFLWLIIFQFLIFTYRNKMLECNCLELFKSFKKNYLYSFLFVNYFTLIPVFYLFYIGSLQTITSLVAGIFCSSALLIPFVFFPNITKWYLLILYPFLLLSSLITLFYALVFNGAISQSEFFVILETNTNETKEFFDHFLNFKVLSVLIFYLIGSIILFLRVKKPQNKSFRHALFLSIVLLFFSFFNDSYQFNSLYAHSIKLIQYNKQFEEFKKNIAIRKQNKDSFSAISSKLSNEKQTYVMVIGESTSRNHLSLYGYSRKTNLKLESIQNELYIFSDVISSACHTLASLNQILTFGNLENMENFTKKGSIVEYMNDAGFETYWISNQQFMGKWETMTSVTAKMCNHNYFLNDPSVTSEDSYDEKIIPVFQSVLQDKPKKKFIIIHLLGTHASYINRYPTKFSVFKDFKGIESQLQLTESKKTIINHYDNAVLYNDYIVFTFIEQLKKQKDISCLFYFSDHGEEVYDSIDFAGHAMANFTNNMYEIPFIGWFSPKYLDTNKYLTQAKPIVEKRKYQLDDVIHTFIDATFLNSDEFVAQKSVINPNFVEENRIIGESGKPYKP